MDKVNTQVPKIITSKYKIATVGVHDESNKKKTDQLLARDHN